MPRAARGNERQCRSCAAHRSPPSSDQRRGPQRAAQGWQRERPSEKWRATGERRIRRPLGPCTATHVPKDLIHFVPVAAPLSLTYQNPAQIDDYLKQGIAVGRLGLFTCEQQRRMARRRAQFRTAAASSAGYVIREVTREE